MRRASVLVLLLVLPALGGCIELPEVTFPLDGGVAGQPLEVAVADDGGHVAGLPVVLRATPVLDDAAYVWSVDGQTIPGPTLTVMLAAGDHEATLTVVRGLQVTHVSHAFTVAADGTDGGDDADDADGEGDGMDGSVDADGDGTPADACGFTTESISVSGRANVFTLHFPWTCQPDSWEWDLGDGTRSREASVRHEYRRDGPHKVTLKMFHDGEARTHTATVQVRDVPLRVVPTVDGAAVTFVLEWGRDVESAEWDLGNGEDSGELTPSTTYSGAGSAPGRPWLVHAIATDAAGKTASVEHELYLDAYPLLVIPDVQQDTVGLSLRWGWPVDTVQWGLDPACAFLDSEATDEAPTIRCDRPGLHAVRVRVAGSGRTALTTAEVEVKEVPLRIHVEQDKDEVTLSPVWYEPLSGFQWSLGDGTFRQEETVTHGYRAYTAFPVTLTAQGAGRTLTAATTVTVSEIPLRVDGVLGDGNVWDAALDWAPATTVTWDFGDGHEHEATDDLEAVQHVFAFQGTYKVRVTAGDGVHTESWEGEVVVPLGLEPDWGDPETKRLRPGVQMTTTRGGSTQQCTAAFLLQSDWDRYFLATAAHCVAAADGAANQAGSDCDDLDPYPLQTPVTFRDWGARDQPDGAEDVQGWLAYSSWSTMQDKGVTDADACLGNDFALVEVSRDDLAALHPAVLHFGGPVEVWPAGTAEAPAAGSGVRAYGASSTRAGPSVLSASASNAKGGQYLAHTGWAHHVRLDNPAIPGDSGGPLMTRDGAALGVLSTVGGDGTNRYTDLAKALAWMEANTDLDVEPVTWADFDPSLPAPASDDLFACPEGDQECSLGGLGDPEGPLGPLGPLPPTPPLPSLPRLIDCEAPLLFPLADCLLFGPAG